MAIADEFLFPMTSRASYSSSYPDSDGEFCEPETPVVSRQPSMILDQMSSTMTPDKKLISTILKSWSKLLLDTEVNNDPNRPCKLYSLILVLPI